jgi:hypothetical protein
MTTPDPQDISLEVAGSQVRLRWAPGAAEDESVSAWHLASEPDWASLEVIRLVSAVFEDGAALGVVAIRPRSAVGHGDDAIVARFLDAEGIPVDASEALLSVEYDRARRPRRLGIELWPEADSAPLRIAADRDPDAAAPAGDGREAVAMAFRSDGVAGSGRYETVRPS